MNKRRLAAIARWLEAGAPHKKGVKGFDMRGFGSCGSLCCIAGTARQWWAPKDKRSEGLSAVVGAEVLGLEASINNSGVKCSLSGGSVADKLFFGDEIDMGQINCNAPWAARCIRKLIVTGTVDWKGTEEESK